ncbi:hypothetical protein HYH02_012854 [Chlamydomonas schloesseri]|uniref:Ferric oxidoreductase domain-containing protein n=1 Tax=Chlamydomonas schloesseri TaxID=2026947 RepID=A0A835T5A1_9CHLO|nr:hypothetical protein HYH02_012854 [Chlamydomonas schloesseri]|eukprot:KAG2432720.1 hypothetical protein HYH02_012854 [Chlamydomonas schloesseri]
MGKLRPAAAPRLAVDSAAMELGLWLALNLGTFALGLSGLDLTAQPYWLTEGEWRHARRLSNPELLSYYVGVAACWPGLWCLALVVLPALRVNAFLQTLLGLPLTSALHRPHAFLGAGAVFWISLHAVLTQVPMAAISGRLWAQQMLPSPRGWYTAGAVNAAGAVSWMVLVLLGATSLPAFRHRSYNTFYLIHLSFPLALLTACLHYQPTAHFFQLSFIAHLADLAARPAAGATAPSDAAAVGNGGWRYGYRLFVAARGDWASRVAAIAAAPPPPSPRAAAADLDDRKWPTAGAAAAGGRPAAAPVMPLEVDSSPCCCIADEARSLHSLEGALCGAGSRHSVLISGGNSSSSGTSGGGRQAKATAALAAPWAPLQVSEAGEVEIEVEVEGPYSDCSTDVLACAGRGDVVALVAGGTGIAPMLAALGRWAHARRPAAAATASGPRGAAAADEVKTMAAAEFPAGPVGSRRANGGAGTSSQQPAGPGAAVDVRLLWVAPAGAEGIVSAALPQLQQAAAAGCDVTVHLTCAATAAVPAAVPAASPANIPTAAPAAAASAAGGAGAAAGGAATPAPLPGGGLAAVALVTPAPPTPQQLDCSHPGVTLVTVLVSVVAAVGYVVGYLLGQALCCVRLAEASAATGGGSAPPGMPALRLCSFAMRPATPCRYCDGVDVVAAAAGADVVAAGLDAWAAGRLRVVRGPRPSVTAFVDAAAAAATAAAMAAAGSECGQQARRLARPKWVISPGGSRTTGHAGGAADGLLPVWRQPSQPVAAGGGGAAGGLLVLGCGPSAMVREVEAAAAGARRRGGAGRVECRILAG